MLDYALAFVMVLGASAAVATETPSALAQCISPNGEILGSVDVLEGSSSASPDNACRITYDKRAIEGTICIRSSSSTSGKACDTPLVAPSKPIGVIACERSDGVPVGRLEIADLRDIDICAPCMLQIGSITLSGRTVFYPYRGEPQGLCYIR